MKFKKIFFTMINRKKVASLNISADRHMNKTGKKVFLEIVLNMMKLQNDTRQNLKILIFCMYHFHPTPPPFVSSSRFRGTDVRLQGRSRTKTVNMTEILWYCCGDETDKRAIVILRPRFTKTVVLFVLAASAA